ncbi:MAG TPA: hypothetical protein VGB82_18305 [Alphaproteobacteria bacterium]
MIALRPGSARRRLLLLGALCAALCGVILAELSDAPPPATPIPQAALRPQSTGAAGDNRPFSMPPRSAFAEVIERPLFSATRRPPEAAAGVAAEAQVDFVLVGIVTSSDERRALVQHGQTARVERISEGDSLGDWRVESILQDRVVFQRADIRLELKARDRTVSTVPHRRPGGAEADAVVTGSGPVQGSSTNLTSVPAPLSKD